MDFEKAWGTVSGKARMNEQELARYARVAYDLVVRQEPAKGYPGRKDHLILRPNTTFSRVEAPEQDLGALVLVSDPPRRRDARKNEENATYVIERANLCAVLKRILGVIREYEKPGDKKWKAECSHVSPISISGIGYFATIEIDDATVAPEGLEVFREKHDLSNEFYNNAHRLSLHAPEPVKQKKRVTKSI